MIKLIRSTLLSLTLLLLIVGCSQPKPYVNISHQNGSRYAALSANKEYLISSSNYDIKLWDIDTLRLVRTIGPGIRVPTFITSTIDSNYIYVGDIKGYISIYNAQTGALKKEFVAHEGEVSYKTSSLFIRRHAASGVHVKVKSIYFSSDGKKFVTSSQKNLKIWDTQTTTTLKKILLNNTKVEIEMAFSPDNKLLAFVSEDRKINILDLKSMQIINSFSDTKSIKTIKFSDNKTLYSNSDKITKWDITKGEVLQEFAIDTYMFLLDFENNLFITAKPQIISFWDLQTGLFQSKIKLENAPGYNLGIIQKISAEQLLLSTLGFTNIINIKDKSLTKEEDLGVVPPSLCALSMSKDNKLAFATGKTTRVFDLQNAKYLLNNNDSYSYSCDKVLAVNKEGTLLALCKNKNRKIVDIWDLKTGKISNSIKMSTDKQIEDITFSMDSKSLYIAYDADIIEENTIYIGKKKDSIEFHKWDLRTSKFLGSYRLDKNFLDSNLYGSILKSRQFKINSYVVNYDIFKAKIDFLQYHRDNRIDILDKNNKVLLSFYSFPDAEWVMITPDGYYNSSKNGSKYLNILKSPMKISDDFTDFYNPQKIKNILSK